MTNVPNALGDAQRAQQIYAALVDAQRQVLDLELLRLRVGAADDDAYGSEETYQQATARMERQVADVWKVAAREGVEARVKALIRDAADAQAEAEAQAAAEPEPAES